MSSRTVCCAALAALLLLSGCASDRQFHTVAVYEAPCSGYAVRMVAIGVVRAGADMSEQSTAVLTFWSASGPAEAAPSITASVALRHGHVELGGESSLEGAWPARGGEGLSRLLSNAGYSSVPEELDELVSAAYGVLLGPKRTPMPGQTGALRVVSVAFDR